MSTAVIIARFQTPYLHDGHKHLIEEIQKKHSKIVIVLGVSRVINTKKNPYDYNTREKLIKSSYNNVLVLPLADNPSDSVWSNNLDELLSTTFPTEKFSLYGSRDSFIQYYNGQLNTEELPAHGDYNSTEIRALYADKVGESEDFRAGILYSIHSQYTKAHPTVDVAVFRNDKTEILLGMKSVNKKWRLIGGFVDAEDSNLEEAAKRELVEEAGPLEVGPLTYELSHNVDDWRYRNEADKIITTVFSCDYIYGTPKAQDDIMTVNWFSVSDLSNLVKNGEISPEHLPLFDFLIKKYDV